MNFSFTQRGFVALAGLAALATAQAGTLSATYTGDYSKAVSFETTFAGHQTLGTELFKGTRTGGTDTLVPSKFLAYCVEIGEYTYADGSTVNNYSSVTPLLGSSTNTGGVTGPVVFDATRTKNLETLWGTYGGSVVDATTSAAFQLAEWEISFDNDLTLTNAAGKVYGTDRDLTIAGIQLDPASQQAENWLASIKNGSATKRQSLLLLSGVGAQDLVTPNPVPEPASFLALGLGAAVAIRRRKK